MIEKVNKEVHKELENERMSTKAKVNNECCEGGCVFTGDRVTDTRGGTWKETKIS